MLFNRICQLFLPPVEVKQLNNRSHVQECSEQVHRILAEYCNNCYPNVPVSITTKTYLNQNHKPKWISGFLDFVLYRKFSNQLKRSIPLNYENPNHSPLSCHFTNTDPVFLSSNPTFISCPYAHDTLKLPFTFDLL